jgi:plastocyanin
LAVNPGTVVNVSLVNHSFSPQTVTAAAGATIVWTNASAFYHTVASDTGVSGLNSDPQYPNGFGPNQTFSWQVPTSAAHGTVYYYHCRFHGAAGNGSSLGTGMCGSITVQ